MTAACVRCARASGSVARLIERSLLGGFARAAGWGLFGAAGLPLALVALFVAWSLSRGVGRRR